MSIVTAAASIAEVLDDPETREAVKARIKAQAMDRFASDFLADDARAWLAGFGATAALEEIRERLVGDLA